MIVVTDVNEDRLARAQVIFPPAEAKKAGIDLIFVNTRDIGDVPRYLKDLTGGTGFDDVHVYASVRTVVEQADQILGRDGCLNFFAGPTDTAFSGLLNYAAD
ncbi:Mannitol-1-phosphate 5-dehydrogenase [Sporomusa carbonis]